MTEASIIGLFVATVSFGALLYLAALGELLAEKAGVLNLGVEGMMAIGAVTAFIVGVELKNPWAALLVAMLSGALLASVHGVFTVGLGAEQVVSGLSLTILGLGLAAYLGKDYVGLPPGAELVPVEWGGLSDLPWIGPIFFNQAPIVYLALLMGIAVSLVLSSTRLGLALRAAGESASSTDSAGHSVLGLRLSAVAAGGALAGASGAYLTLSITPVGWGLTAGRGWIAVALVIFGAWRPGKRGDWRFNIWWHACVENTFTTIRRRLFTDYSFNASLRTYAQAILLIISVRARRGLPQRRLGWVWHTVARNANYFFIRGN